MFPLTWVQIESSHSNFPLPTSHFLLPPPTPTFNNRLSIFHSVCLLIHKFERESKARVTHPPFDLSTQSKYFITKTKSNLMRNVHFKTSVNCIVVDKLAISCCVCAWDKWENRHWKKRVTYILFDWYETETEWNFTVNEKRSGHKSTPITELDKRSHSYSVRLCAYKNNFLIKTR